MCYMAVSATLMRMRPVGVLWGLVLWLTLTAAATADFTYARQLIQRGEYALAAVTLKKQLQEDPLEARALLAEVHLYEGDVNAALRYLESARQLGLSEKRYYALKGRIALLQGEWDAAWAALRSAVALSGSGADALFWGTVGLAQGNLERAQLGYEKAARSGLSAQAGFLQGLALLSERPQQALALLRAAQTELTAEDPLKPQVIYWQARALERLGNAKEARSTLRFLLRSYPGYTPAREALNRLGP